ncbi:hypothetical protein N7491_006786 [Penicillium cf. griseofulvum]|nr:hypothetical protein N7491_006786 [Penicillium cf. griseofulvum]
MQVPAADIDQMFAHTTNLVSRNLSSKIIACSNDYFASADNVLTPTPSVSRPGVFVHTGAWYDGWETRRHNPEPYDWTVIKLGVAAAYIHGIEVHITHYIGNHGEKTELQATHAPEGSGIADPRFAGWKTLLPASPCGPSQRHGWKFPAEITQSPYTHFRLLMYPDGGFARLRLYGHAIPPPSPAVQAADVPIKELWSALGGGVARAAFDEHFTPSSNILLPDRGKDMGDGPRTSGVPSADAVNWVEIVKGDKRCQADTEHVFGPDDLTGGGEDTRLFSHVKLTLVPDGGVKRFCIFGRRV